MDLIGNRVKHNKFGEGVIIQQEASYVSVKFMTEDEPKALKCICEQKISKGYLLF